MTKPLTPEEVDKIEARFKKATPGPWEYFKGPSNIPPYDYAVFAGDTEIFQTGCDNFGRNNPAFIASARTDVPRLCADWRRMREELNELWAVIELCAKLKGTLSMAVLPQKAGKKPEWNALRGEGGEDA